MKVEEKVLSVYSPADIGALARWKPKTCCHRRLQAIVLMLADAGCRISELIGLRWQDVSFDDLLLTVRGKGNKQRTIPFSLELRKYLFKLKQQSTKAGRRPAGQPPSVVGRMVRDSRYLGWRTAVSRLIRG